MLVDDSPLTSLSHALTNSPSSLPRHLSHLPPRLLTTSSLSPHHLTTSFLTSPQPHQLTSTHTHTHTHTSLPAQFATSIADGTLRIEDPDVHRSGRIEHVSWARWEAAAAAEAAAAGGAEVVD